MRRFAFAACVFAALVAVTGSPAGADERILDFRSDIAIAADGVITVTETIRVRAEGNQIKRGIYRDFPTKYPAGWLGTKRSVPFEIVGITRDGHSEPYHTESRGNGIRLYVGSKDVFVDRGEHTYTLTYTTARQLAFLDDHDELYWNVTGNGWEFPIDHAEAVVTLPAPASPPEGGMNLFAWVGPQGSTDTTGVTHSREGDRAVFAATRVLRPSEGLTISVKFAKGIVAPPGVDALLIVGLIGLIVVWLYYQIAWLFVGRDPQKGVIYPRFEAPKGLGPAACRYLMKMGFDKTCITAALIDMAVKGYLVIEQDGDDFSLRRAGKVDEALSPGEKRVALALLRGRQSIELDKANHAKFSKATDVLKDTLRGELRDRHFSLNLPYLVVGLVLTVLAITAATLTLPVEGMAAVAFLSAWLSIWTIGVIALLTAVVTGWVGVIRRREHRLATLGGTLFITAFSIPFVVGEVVAIVMLGAMASLFFLVLVMLLGALGASYYRLLKAPTATGRKVMDEIDGLRMYLRTAEADRLNFAHAPKKTPELFEKLLPYAVALDVENEWAKQFEEVLARAAQGAEGGYQPMWYHGAAWSTLGAAGFASSIGSSLGSAVSAASVAPGSGSGGGFSGGGGSSGGGGGGGGGGGW